ncbi:MAG: hypothetical protein ABEJ07_06705 [Candidatus Nanohaloarchaea archaeon]
MTTREIMRELGGRYDENLTEHAVDSILGVFHEEGLLERTEQVPWSRNATYRVNGAGPEDYDSLLSRIERDL